MPDIVKHIIKTIAYLFVCIIVSCSKDNTKTNSNVPGAGGSVQFKVNGQLIVINNKSTSSGQYAQFNRRIYILPIQNDTSYEMASQNGQIEGCYLTFHTDSLHEIHYHYDSLGGDVLGNIVDNSNGSAPYFKDDYLDVNITSYKNSRISGNFNGKFSPFTIGPNWVFDYNSRGSKLITEGRFDSLAVYY